MLLVRQILDKSRNLSDSEAWKQDSDRLSVAYTCKTKLVCSETRYFMLCKKDKALTKLVCFYIQEKLDIQLEIVNSS